MIGSRYGSTSRSTKPSGGARARNVPPSACAVTKMGSRYKAGPGMPGLPGGGKLPLPPPTDMPRRTTVTIPTTPLVPEQPSDRPGLQQANPAPSVPTLQSMPPVMVPGLPEQTLRSLPPMMTAAPEQPTLRMAQPESPSPRVSVTNAIPTAPSGGLMTVNLGMTCDQFRALSFGEQRMQLGFRNPGLSGDMLNQVHAQVLGQCRGVTAPSGYGAPGSPEMPNAPATPGTQTQQPNIGATLAQQLPGQIGGVLTAIIQGAFGMEAARLAREGQSQAAVMAAQQNAQNTTLERNQLQQLQQQLATLQNANPQTTGTGSSPTTTEGGIPTWGWVLIGTGSLAVVGGGVWLATRNSSPRRLKSGR